MKNITFLFYFKVSGIEKNFPMHTSIQLSSIQGIKKCKAFGNTSFLPITSEFIFSQMKIKINYFKY